MLQTASRLTTRSRSPERQAPAHDALQNRLWPDHSNTLFQSTPKRFRPLDGSAVHRLATLWPRLPHRDFRQHGRSYDPRETERGGCKDRSMLFRIRAQSASGTDAHWQFEGVKLSGLFGYRNGRLSEVWANVHHLRQFENYPTRKIA